MNMNRASGAALIAGSEISSLPGLCWMPVFFTSLVLLLHWNAHQHLGGVPGWVFSIFHLCEGCRSPGSRMSSLSLTACTTESGKVWNGLH